MTSVTDNLYVLDDNNNESTNAILEYFIANIDMINKITKRYIRPYRLTPQMLKDKTYIDKLKERKVEKLPSVVCFKPRHEVFCGVNEITFFYNSLMSSIVNIQRQLQESNQNVDDGEKTLGGDNDMLHNFYKGEITGNDQEKSVNNEISTNMSDRYRQSLSKRSKSSQGQPGRSPGGGEIDNDDDDFDFNKSLQDRRRGNSRSTTPGNLPPSKTEPRNGEKTNDNIMDSVKKACGSDELEVQFFQNILEDSSKL